MIENNIMAFLEKNPDLFKEMENIGIGSKTNIGVYNDK